MSIDDVTEVTLGELVHAPALAGGRLVRLENGDYVELEERIRRVLAALSAGAARAKPRGDLQLHPAAVGTLEELAQAGFELDAEASGWLERVKRVSSMSFEAPRALRADLRTYQLEGYRWLRQLTELGLGACPAGA